MQSYDRSTELISIHALREEGDREERAGLTHGAYFSIHALREEGDRWTAAAA